MAPVVEALGEEWGIDIHHTWYDFATKDFYPVLTAALRHDPDCLWVTQSGGYAQIRNARELGFEGQFVLPEMVPPWWDDLISPDDLESLISLTPALDSPEVEQAYKDYLMRYEERVGALPYANKVYTYYSIPYLVAAVIKSAGGIDTDKMIEVMATQELTLEYPNGVTKTVKFGGEELYGVNHNWNPNVYLSITENGKQVHQATYTNYDQLYYAGLAAKYAGSEYVREEIEETEELPEQELTIDSTIGLLLDNPETKAILEKHIPEVISNPRLPLTFTLRALFSAAGDQIDQSKLPLIEADLEALYGE